MPTLSNPLVLPRIAKVVLLLALVAYIALRGLLPAWSAVGSDFPGYLTSARIVVDRGDVERLYDNSWFQQQMGRYHIGTPSQGKFAPFPPPTALLLVPIARLSPLSALRVVTCLSVLALGLSVFLLARILDWSLLDGALLVLLSGFAIINSLRLGQPYMLVSLSCIVAYYAYLQKRSVLCGICLGLFTPIKYFPIINLIYFGFRREWRIVAAGLATIVAIGLLSIGVLGWKIHLIFLDSVLGGHLVGKLSMQDPFTATFQSFDSLFRRLFVFDATANPHPAIAWPALDVFAVFTTKLLIFGMGMASLVRVARQAPHYSVQLSLGLLGILLLLLAPATGTYYSVLLWLPVGLVVDLFLRERAPVAAYLVLGIYAAIGFFPYSRTIGFEGRGALTVLAYPRLFLMLAMFLTCVNFAWRPPPKTL